VSDHYPFCQAMSSAGRLDVPHQCPSCCSGPKNDWPNLNEYYHEQIVVVSGKVFHLLR